ncbi:MAG: ABC transporter substrate-binding protein [Deltaproteobacteria bacterium]|nr:ABC transporter substrate-binding protein [Deltaproteobacteria bacterium]
MRQVCAWLFSVPAALFLSLAACTSDDPAPAGGDPAGGDPGITCSANTTDPALKVGGIFTLTTGPSANVEKLGAIGFEMFIDEVNRNCGTVGTETGGLKLEGVEKDGKDDGPTAGTVAGELITEGVVMMIGASGSLPTTEAAKPAVAAGKLFGLWKSASDLLQGCTQAQLDDAGVTKTTTPVFAANQCWDNGHYVMGNQLTSTGFGKTAAKWVKADPVYSLLLNAAEVFRNDGFGKPTEAAFAAAFPTEGGRTVSARVVYPPNATKDQFKTLIKDGNPTATPAVPAVVVGNPQLIVVTTRVGEFKAFLEAWAELSADATWTTKPSNFDTCRFIGVGTLSDNYSSLSANAFAIWRDRVVGTEPYYNPTGVAYEKFWTAYQNYDPSVTEADAYWEKPATYDTMMVLTLAMVKANSTDSSVIRDAIQDVANPPGTVVYPGEFKKARALLFAGEDIDYEGGTGHVDITDTGFIRSKDFRVWAPNADGTVSTKDVFESAYSDQ